MKKDETIHPYEKYRPAWCKHPPFDSIDFCWGLADEEDREITLQGKCTTCDESEYFTGYCMDCKKEPLMESLCPICPKNEDNK